MHFSSVFRENTSSLPVPETKFNGSEGERLGQLVVTPEVVASKINNMKENKSPGVDGISPKILKEKVEQISMPLAHVFNMSASCCEAFYHKRKSSFLISTFTC